jgi:hypothetical protein
MSETAILLVVWLDYVRSTGLASECIDGRLGVFV